MADEKRPSRNLISKAIRSERQSNGEVDLDHLKDTLAKSSLWKTNTLRRIEDNRSGKKAEAGVANDGNDAVLQSLKRSLLQLVDQHWRQLAPATSADGDVPSEDRRIEPVSVADTQRRDTKLQNEYNGMRKALSVQVKEVIKVRRRLRKQEKKVKERDEEISELQKTIAELRAEKNRMAEQHEQAISRLQSDKNGLTEQHAQAVSKLRAENDSLKERHEEAVSELQAENDSLKERHAQAVSQLQAENDSLKAHHKEAVSELRAENAGQRERYEEEITGQHKRLIELQDAYDQFQQQSDQLLTELDRENALLRAGETPANDDAQFTSLDVNAQ